MKITVFSSVNVYTYMILTTVLPIAITTVQAYQTPSEELCQSINEYRNNYNLPQIPLSQPLMYTAEVHLRDLSSNGNYPCLHPNGNPSTNIVLKLNNSWSDNAPESYQACCYQDIEEDFACMQNKPTQLTRNFPTEYQFKGKAYEITFWGCNDPKCVSDQLFSNKNSYIRNILLNNDEVGWGGNFLSMGCALDKYKISNFTTIWLSYSTNLPYLHCINEMPKINGDKIPRYPADYCEGQISSNKNTTTNTTNNITKTITRQTINKYTTNKQHTTMMNKSSYSKRAKIVISVLSVTIFLLVIALAISVYLYHRGKIRTPTYA